MKSPHGDVIEEVVLGQDAAEHDQLQDGEVVAELVAVVQVHTVSAVVAGHQVSRLSGPAALGTSTDKCIQF